MEDGSFEALTVSMAPVTLGGMSVQYLRALGCGLLLTGCTGAGAEVLAPQPPQPGGRQLTMMSFNVHRDESGDRGTVEAVGAPNADIVCLQEPNVAWEHALRARYATQYPHMLFWPTEDTSGLGILSHYPLEDRGIATISDWHPAWIVMVDTPEGPLQIVNVHLRARFDGDHDSISNYFATDADHVKEVELFVERTVPHVATVFIGDFNEDPSGPAIQWLEERGFEDALPRFHPGQHTWRGRSILSSMVMSIDHILYSRPLVPLDAWVAPRGRSDHLPVLARFEVAQSLRGAALAHDIRQK